MPLEIRENAISILLVTVPAADISVTLPVLHLSGAAHVAVLEVPAVLIAVGPRKDAFAPLNVVLVLTTVESACSVVELALAMNVVVEPLASVATTVGEHVGAATCKRKKDPAWQ